MGSEKEKMTQDSDNNFKEKFEIIFKRREAADKEKKRNEIKKLYDDGYYKIETIPLELRPYYLQLDNPVEAYIDDVAKKEQDDYYNNPDNQQRKDSITKRKEISDIRKNSLGGYLIGKKKHNIKKCDSSFFVNKSYIMAASPFNAKTNASLSHFLDKLNNWMSIINSYDAKQRKKMNKTYRHFIKYTSSGWIPLPYSLMETFASIDGIPKRISIKTFDTISSKVGASVVKNKLLPFYNKSNSYYILKSNITPESKTDLYRLFITAGYFHKNSGESKKIVSYLKEIGVLKRMTNYSTLTGQCCYYDIDFSIRPTSTQNLLSA